MFSKYKEFLLYDKLGVYIFSLSDLRYPNMKVRLQVLRTQPKFYFISENPNASVRIVDCSLCSRFALNDDYHEKSTDMVAYTHVEYKFWRFWRWRLSSFPDKYQFIQENVSGNVPVRRIAPAMNKNSAFSGSLAENPSWYIIVRPQLN